MKKKLFAVLMVSVVALSLCACREVDRVSYNLSKEADNFNVARRLTVFDTRTDTVMFQMTGTFSITTDPDDGQLEVTCELPDGTYSKHFAYLSRDTTYIVEDLSGTDVSKYSYELNFLPQTIPGVKITSND